jgi:DNA-3-methyladenine glycosylase II
MTTPPLLSRWDEALAHLRAADPRMAAWMDGLPLHPPALKTADGPQLALSRAVVAQQLSTKAAATIWARVRAAAGPRLEGLPTLDPAALRACGVSAAKARALLGLAEAAADGALAPGAWAALDDEALIRHLVRLRGVGRWTAEMFLIFHEGRADVFAVDDVGLRRAVERGWTGGAPVDKAGLGQLSAPWAPFRSAASVLLWRGLDGPATLPGG